MAGLDEESIIAILNSVAGERPDVRLGMGDDGAVLEPPPDRELVSVMDTLNEGVHFPVGLPAAAIAHRALAANLSDLAAMGSSPAWATLALSLPDAERGWVTDFARGFAALASRFRLALIGGDTVRGPLSVTIQLTGFVEPGGALRRDGARGGELIVVSGSPGEAAAGLARLETTDPDSEPLRRRFLWPEPRVGLGRSLAGLATAAIDISDGLAIDLGRLVRASDVGAVLDLDRLPVSSAARRVCGDSEARRMALVGGDDYELCFTIAAGDRRHLARLARQHGCAVTEIGAITDGAGLEFREGGRPVAAELSGAWRHFAEGEA